MQDDLPKTGNFLAGRLRHAMSRREQELLEELMGPVREYGPDHVLQRRAELVSESTILMDGFIIRSVTEGGQRQIVEINVPGDFVDLHGFALKRLDHDLTALGPVRVTSVSHIDLANALAKEPHLARILWFATLLEAAIHREWILKMGQLRADARLAHVFAELWQRLDFVGRSRRNGFDTPLKQTDLADICGTTPVYINRLLRDLREADMAEFRRGRVWVSSREKLERHCRFSPDYLYGQGTLAVRDELDPENPDVRTAATG